MYQLKLKDFKAHKELTVPFNNQSFLLYGDNGAGKSSIYDALKVKFFEQRIKDNITSKVPDEEYAEVISEFWEQYKNSASSASNFEIELLQQKDEELILDNYQVFMLNLEDTFFDKYLKIEELIKKVYFSLHIDPNIPPLAYQDIEDKTNTLLERFKEEIHIEIDLEDNKIVKITDESKNLMKKKDIKYYFNESKLNLVVLSILFSIIELTKDSREHKVLVLDDFITSLDMSNRTFLMKYVLETFGNDFQIIILTHNIYFYNLIRHLINETYKVVSKWNIANLYENNKEHKLYINPSNKMKKRLELNTLEEKLNSLSEDSIGTLGNDFRQKFEILLYEFSKILMVGGVEETKNILDKLVNKKRLYFYKDGNKLKGSIELIEEIEKIIESGSQNIEDITNVINTYVINDFDEIHRALRDLKLYQKVHMHHLSHGHIGDSNFSVKEATDTLLLLRKLESIIFNLMHQEMAGA